MRSFAGRSLAGDVKWGLRGAAALTVVYCLWTCLVYVLGGDTAFAAAGVGFATVLITYATIGFACGVIVGLCRPWLQRRHGPKVLGVIIAFVLSTGIMASVKGPPWTWRAEAWFSVIVVSAALGLFASDELAKILRAERASSK